MGFPVLEVLAVAARAPSWLTAGARFQLSAAFTIGAGPGSSLVLNAPRVSRLHCRIEWKFERWWLLDLGGAYGSTHNGAPVVNVELRHLDTIGVGEVIFRFLTREPRHHEEAAMERAILSRPDDLTCWRVYADWLQEQGDELGERIARAEPEDDGRWLGLLAPWWSQGYLEVSWFSGLPRRVLLRNPRDEPAPRELRYALAPLATDSSFRFLRGLELDVESLRGDQELDALLAELLPPLAAAALPLFEELVLGPLSEPPAPSTLALARSALPRGAKATLRWEKWPAQVGLEVLATPKSVEVRPAPGEWAALRPDEESLIGKLASCLVWLRAEPGHAALQTAVRLALTDTWHAEDLLPANHLLGELGLRVNGRVTGRSRLRPGDLLEVAPGVLLRFGALP